MNESDVTCYACDGPGVYIGSLGDLMYFRCRNCGAEYSITVDYDDDEVDEINDTLSDMGLGRYSL